MNIFISRLCLIIQVIGRSSGKENDIEESIFFLYPYKDATSFSG